MDDRDAANLDDTGKPAPRRRRWLVRLSLRASMGLVLVLGGALGWVVRRATVQRDAVAAIRATGGTVGYDRGLIRTIYLYGEQHAPFQPPPSDWWRWVDDGLGLDYLWTVKMVSLGPGTTDATMAHVGRLDQLEELDAPRGDELSNDGLVHLRSLPKLRGFALHRSRGVTGAGLVHLAGSLGLERLHFGHNPVSDVDMIHVRGLVNLRLLRFYAADGITDLGLRRLSGLSRLRGLIINRSQVTGQGLVALSRMQAMDQLMFLGSRIENLQALRPMTKLSGLFVTKSPLDDAGFSPVAEMASLLHVELDDTWVTDAGFQALVGLAKLRKVSLKGCPITDEGAAAFQQARPLVVLSR